MTLNTKQRRKTRKDRKKVIENKKFEWRTGIPVILLLLVPILIPVSIGYVYARIEKFQIKEYGVCIKARLERTTRTHTKGGDEAVCTFFVNNKRYEARDGI